MDATHQMTVSLVTARWRKTIPVVVDGYGRLVDIRTPNGTY